MVLLLSHFQVILCCQTAEEVTTVFIHQGPKIKTPVALDQITLSSFSVKVSRSVGIGEQRGDSDCRFIKAYAN